MTERILAVDDDRLVRMSVRIHLEREGFEVDTAADVDEAFDHIDRFHYALVVTDLRLPDGSGLDVIRHALEVDPKTKTILITASDGALDTEDALRAGASEVVLKPFTLERLARETRRAIGDGQRPGKFDQRL